MNSYALGSLRAFLDVWLTQRSLTTDIHGFSVAVSEGSDVIFSQAFGKDSKKPLTTSHLFNIGSQAKMFTATAIMQLVDRGDITLETSAVDVLPWLAQHPNAEFQYVTIAQLLAHEAGIVRDGQSANFWQMQQPFPNDIQLRHIVLQSQLVKNSPHKVKYSNLGYALLGQILQTVSGLAYGAYIDTFICKPLGLNSTYVDGPGVPQDRIATGYTRPLPKRHAVPKYIPVGALAPATGIYSTAKDISTFMVAHSPESNLLLPRHAKDYLHNHLRHHWAPQEARSVPYAHGFYQHTFANTHVIGHGGSFIGHSSCSFLDARRNISVSVCASIKDAPQMEMQLGIWSAIQFFTAHATRPALPEVAALNRTVKNIHNTISIVATDKKIVAATIDSWTPFHNADELVCIGKEECQIVAGNDFRSKGEMVHIPANPAQPVNYAGSTMVPIDLFDGWLAKTLSP